MSQPIEFDQWQAEGETEMVRWWVSFRVACFVLVTMFPLSPQVTP